MASPASPPGPPSAAPKGLGVAGAPQASVAAGSPKALAAPRPGSPATSRFATGDPRWALTHYVVREKRFTIGRQYEVFDSQGRLVAYCKQKLFRLKEDIRFYADASQGVELFRLAARTIMDFRANVDIIDSATGATLCSVRRKGWKSLVKDEWMVFDAAGTQVGTLHEQGAFLSFLRRWGDLAATLIPARYKLFIGPSGQERQAAEVKERFQIWGDTYDVHADPAARIDGRVLVGLVVLTDAFGVGGKAN